MNFARHARYGLVGFELFILGASIRALRRGTSPVPRQAEVAMHVACFAIAALAFGVFYALCANINTDGYNTSTENEAYTNVFNHASTDDDLDDIEPSGAASFVFQSQRDAYDNLVRDMLVSWDVVVSVAVGMWIVLRALHHHALRALRTEAAATARAEENDEWADTRRSAWEVRRRLLVARREAFDEVAKPLEPYIFVFVLFAAPAFVMSTTFCQSHSGARVAGHESVVGDVGGTSTDFTYGTCDVWCEFVLAFRSLGTVAVYLVPRERRVELVAVRSTLRKLFTRVFGCICRRTRAPYAPLSHGHRGEYEMGELEQQQQQMLAADGLNNNRGFVAAADSSSWHINECDVSKVRQLGEGAFGGVWECRLLPEDRRVAVKILFAGTVDDDGDAVDPNAEEDFYKECAALQRVDSPHLIKFFGFGTTTEGNGFIVTELMSGGSLEAALHDCEHDLAWRLRVMIGMHVALGMEHLHERHMLHRDLKSANVLLNEQRTEAKVCDFGLTRIAKPTRRQHVVVYSPFTGSVRVLPRVGGVDISSGQSVLSMAHVSVCIMDARGTMTKAVGTQLWMAPEVFRGDQSYTNAVDVYSFGVVLWELATRKTPWVGELSSNPALCFAELNSALQTGRRPAIPTTMLAEHGAFAVVMQRCWAGDPEHRLTFSKAARDLATIINA
jgi:hypothetical protein